MSEDARGAVREEMDGLSTEAAVDRILERDDSLDPDDVRERIEYVTSDGVVCREGIEDGLGEVSGIISTPENRIDIARREFETATDLADPVSDLRIVAVRLEGFEERLLALKREVDRLGPELNELFNEWLEEGDDVYAMADGLHQHADRGRRMHALVDELIRDLESFQEWVQDEDVRVEELDRDLEGVDESLDDLENAVSELEGDEEPSGDGGGVNEPEPVFVWVDAALRYRLVGLLVDDLRTELDGLRKWGEREGTANDEQCDRLAERISLVRSRWEALEERIDATARQTWRDRFDDRIAAFESDLEDFEPPVDWGEVQRALQEQQEEIGPEAETGA